MSRRSNRSRRICRSIFLTSVSCLLALAPGFASAQDAVHRPHGLRCESLENPQGLEASAPRLSWLVETTRRGWSQSAYHILVASTPERLNEGIGDLWDSGKVLSADSNQIDFRGKPLSSRQACFWKVRVWDRDEQASDWSEVAEWRMGLLKPQDWQGKWITLDNKVGMAHPWLRRTFDLATVPREARVYVCTPGQYELYINGTKVDDDVLAPAQSQLTRRFFYNVRDVAGLLRPGKNCVALWLGPGWYQARAGNSHHAPIVMAQLEVTDESGNRIIPTDASWRASDSCISQIGSYWPNDFGGERWDVGRFIEDWNQPDFDDSAWATAIEIKGPKVALSWQAIPYSRLGPPQEPQRVFQKDGRWVLDFGINTCGWLRCRLTGLKPGQEVTIEYADLGPGQEHLIEKESAKAGFQTFNQKDVYVAGAKSEDVFCSKFNRHGFRFAVIGGLDKAPEKADASAMMVSTALPRAGEFSCSHLLFNRIHDVTVRTFDAQNTVGVLGSGETRERLGYGDGGSFLTGFLYNFQSDAFFRKWLGDWCDNQRKDGFMGHVAPDYGTAPGGGPSWCGQASELVRRLHLYYGDRRIVEERYDALRRCVDYIERQAKEDLLVYYNPYKPRQWKKWYFLGDWTPPGPDPDKESFVFENKDEQEFFNNCYRILLWDQLAGFAAVRGDEAEVKRCHSRMDVLRPLVHKSWWDESKKTYRVNRQSYLTIALLSGVVPAELRAEVLRQLEHDLVVTKKQHMDAGLQGSAMLLDLWTRENRPDLIARIMSQTTYPGWGFLLEKRGVTTWPETWAGWNSQIILVTATPGAWFYEGLAGIRPDPQHPGFRHFTIRPGIVPGVDWVKCRYPSPYGSIVSNWRVADGRCIMEVFVPANTRATVWVPADDASRITESGKPADQAQAVRLLRMEKGMAGFEVGSGIYSFGSNLPPGHPAP